MSDKEDIKVEMKRLQDLLNNIIKNDGFSKYDKLYEISIALDAVMNEWFAISATEKPNP